MNSTSQPRESLNNYIINGKGSTEVLLPCVTHQVIDSVLQESACMIQQFDCSIVRTQSNEL